MRQVMGFHLIQKIVNQRTFKEYSMGKKFKFKKQLNKKHLLDIGNEIAANPMSEAELEFYEMLEKRGSKKGPRPMRQEGD